MQTVTRPTQNNHPPPQNEKNPEQERNRPPQYQTTDPRTTTTKKKKRQVREQSLGESAEHGVRVVGEDRVQQEENTRGNPNPKRGWVSPAPEREREREREKKKKERKKNVVGEQTKQKKKERGDTNIKANKGRVLKGTKPNNISTPKTMKPTQETIQIPRNHLTKITNTKQTESQGNYHSRVAGPMGRPALSEETPQGTVVPRGPQTPPPREPPPVAQELATCRTISKYPRKM